MTRRLFVLLFLLLVPQRSRAEGPQPFEHFAPTEPDPSLYGLHWPWSFKPDVPQVPIEIDPVRLEHDVQSLSGVLPVTVNGGRVTISERATDENLDNARAWLAAQYEAMGFTVSQQGGWGGANFIAEKLGRDPNHFVVVSSHLDSVEGVPGADDDASGTATALAIARALVGYQFENSLRMVAFDKEEDGLVGSSAYVDSLREAGQLGAILGVLHLEMTGYDPKHKGAIHSIDCNKAHSVPLTRLVNAGIRDQNLALHRVEGCTDRSDHASFWKRRVPAIVVSENFFGGGGNPCYHRACDTADRLNFTYMANIARAVGYAAVQLLHPVQSTPDT